MERGSLMLNTTTFVGLDVHARSIKAVALDVMTGETKSATFAYDAAVDWLHYPGQENEGGRSLERKDLRWRTRSTPGTSARSSSAR